MLKWNELNITDKRFVREQYLQYLESEHDADFLGNHEGRGRAVWAWDKAWDDLVSRRKRE
jgi:hypothetical protein